MKNPPLFSRWRWTPGLTGSGAGVPPAGEGDWSANEDLHTEITLRDLFAAFIASTFRSGRSDTSATPRDFELAAWYCYEFADALLAQREKAGKP